MYPNSFGFGDLGNTDYSFIAIMHWSTLTWSQIEMFDIETADKQMICIKLNCYK